VRRTPTLGIPQGTPSGVWRLRACVRRRCRLALLPVRIPFLRPTVPAAPGASGASPPAGSRFAVDHTSVEDCEPRIPAPDAPPEQFTQMFADASKGWTGGDGTLSVVLPSGATAWWFGDTFLGGLTQFGGRDQMYPDINNTVVVQDRCLSTRFRGSLDAPLAFELSSEGSWYWPNQPVVHGDRVRVFLSRMVPHGQYYRVDGVALATYGLDLSRQSVRDVPALRDQWWGAALVDDGPHTYVFGIQDAAPFEKRVYLARTPVGDLDGAWEYRTANGWSASLADARPVLVDPEHVSTQLSVLREGTGWALVSQDVATEKVNVWRGAAPWAWGQRELMTELPRPIGGRTYNAMIQPGKAAGDQHLVSYNFMASPPEGTLAQASLYRPRFVRAALP
jgi:hypothetical protein